MELDIIERRRKNSSRRHTELNYAEPAARLCSLAEQLPGMRYLAHDGQDE
jgi:hypothetical protein